MFSGHVQHYKCPSCGNELSDITPTSILPMLGVIGFATFQWSVFLSQYVPRWYFRIPAAIGLAVVSLFLMYTLVDLPSWYYRKRCRKCGGEFETVGGAFYDFALIPQPLEALIYVLVIVLPIVVRKLVQ